MTKDEVIDLIAEELCTPRALIKMDSTLRDLATDSLELVSLAVELENSSGVLIEDEDLAKFFTVGDIVKHLEAA